MSITGERAANKATKAVDMLNAPIVAEADLLNPVSMINDTSLSGKRAGAMVYVILASDGSLGTAVAQGSKPTDEWLIQTGTSTSVPATRKKIEVLYSDVNLVIPTTVSNLVALLKTLTPTSGSLSNFINTTSDKLNVYNDNSSVLFKINITGTWASSSQNRSMILNFTGTSGNTLTVTRVDNTSPDVVQFFTYFSIDKDGNIATNGSAPTIQSNGSVFTATSILLTIEQVTSVASITPV